MKEAYDLIQIGNKTRIIKKRNQDSYVTLVPVEDTFAILDRVHKSIGHKGRDLMLKTSEMKEYSNVTVEMIKAYLDCCKYCAEEKKRRMDLIDFQSLPDGEFKWIMVYQDHLTKFVVLRPLKAKEAV